MNTIAGFALSLSLLASVEAQDMVAVDWTGQVYALNSTNAAVTLLGTGLFGQDATAVQADGTIWSTHRTGSSPNWTFHATTISPSTGQATIVHAGLPDIRALANAGSNSLWCLVNGNPDRLYRLDLATGTTTYIGSTGVRGIEGLAVRGPTLYAWHTGSGLMTLDTSSGRATDVNSAIGGGGGSLINFLEWRPDGKLIGGKTSLYEIDPATGAYQLIGPLGPGIDLRGAVAWYPSIAAFGSGCSGAFGTVTHTVSGLPRPGGQLTSRSDNHASGAFGILAIGGSRSSANGLSLPLNLDPILGTRGCSLLVSLDVLATDLTDRGLPANLVFPIPLPPGIAGLDMHLQHFTLEPVSGGISASNGVTVKVAY